MKVREKRPFAGHKVKHVYISAGRLDCILVFLLLQNSRGSGEGKNGFPQLILPVFQLEIVCKLATVTCSLFIISFFFFLNVIRL